MSMQKTEADLLAAAGGKDCWIYGRLLLAAPALLLAAAVEASPVHVAIDQGGAMEYGAGYSVGNGTDCFVITPHHVIATAQKDEITVTDARGRQSKANVYKEAPDRDAALLKLSDPAGFECSAELPDGIAGMQAAGSAKWVTARKVNGTGGVRQSRWFIASTSPDELVLEPYGKQDKLQEGDSGSSVYAGDALLGMVVSTNTASNSVRVLTQGQIHALFSADLAPTRSQKLLLQPFVYRNQPNPYATVAAREYLGAKTPLSVHELTVNPQTPPMSSLPPAESVPDGYDYLVLGDIISLSQTREANPNYKPANQRDDGNFGDRLLKSLGRSLTGKNETARYFVIYNIDVQVQVLDVARNSGARNLERQVIKLPLENSNAAELEKSAIQMAVMKSLQQTFQKYGLPLDGS